MRIIAAGDTAPDFSLTDNRQDTIKLSDYRGKRVLLSWHPLAWTRVCAEQMKNLEENFAELTGLNTVPLGISVDPYPSKNAWAKELKIANVRLPSDFWPHGKVAGEYGLFRAEEGFSERANVVVDETGKVVWVKIYPVPELPDIQEVLAVLKKYNK
ncbi:MAG TPA: redoxin domain-containing protein [Methylomusa anaerophila]|uniref:Putative peroxiredoxin/MT2298 n=1 Tax=Methylomusa anaerophila TaxID=1930071 RepID=A0A348AHF9_9FIRM|nr:redoxin domain-containing protein [Methylomusa anaerophila]BBB90507.1 putative peroxiredoxin/MT2298 [Methylomusa anaerophila]HML89853.1 redoxin domain-containing protein [Methylomusa anaerophila]